MAHIPALTADQLAVSHRAAVTAQRQQALPGVNTPVRLILGGGGTGHRACDELASRVEDVRTRGRHSDAPGPELYVAVPRRAGDVAAPPDGLPCEVAWPTCVGVYSLATAFSGQGQVGAATRSWRLRVTGSVVQRRSYLRMPWKGLVTVEIGGPAPDAAIGAANRAAPDRPPAGAVLAGTTVDLSEGGVRCVLPAPAPAPGQALVVRLPLGDRVLTLVASAVWSRPAPPRHLLDAPGGARRTASHLVQVGIAFTDPEEHADLLRRALFTAQLLPHRTELA